MGSVIKDGKSTSASTPKPSRSILVKNLPKDFVKDEVEEIAAQFGTIKKCQQVSIKDGDRMDNYVSVMYETPDMAQHALEQMDNYDMRGNRLHVDLQNYSSRQNNHSRAPRNNAVDNRYGTGYPLRILVPSELVGAIIGKKGQTIRNITTTCKARVDVHGKDNSGLLEKVISIFGQPENCSSACKEILKVMQQEATTNNKGQIVLRMLADDRYCGRIIGKEGKLIKKIRDDSDTKITVSSMQDMAHMYPDRVITIRGGIDNLVQAEGVISSKLIECMEKDTQSANMGMIPAGPTMPLLPHGGVGGAGYPNMRRNIYGGGVPQMGGQMGPPMYGGMGGGGMGVGGGMMHGGGGMGGPMGGGGGTAEMCQIFVPNAAVGAIIGAGGSIIKQIMQDSNAHVTVEPKREEDANNPNCERTVVVRGTTDACWKASYFIFEKMKLDGMNQPMADDVRLRTAIKIPKAMVGRVIGKSGKNVREIQRMTGASIKLPEDPNAQGEEVLVEVQGNFMATQGAHNRIRSLVSQSIYGGGAPNGQESGPYQGPSRGGPGGPGGRRTTSGTRKEQDGRQ